MMDARLEAVLLLVFEQEGLSLPRAAKTLRLGQSQLLRLLVELGDVSGGGLGLIELKHGLPPRLFLSSTAHAQMETPR